MELVDAAIPAQELNPIKQTILQVESVKVFFSFNFQNHAPVIWFMIFRVFGISNFHVFSFSFFILNLCSGLPSLERKESWFIFIS